MPWTPTRPNMWQRDKLVLLQTAGYMVQYNGLTYATVRGSGHEVIICHSLDTHRLLIAGAGSIQCLICSP